MVSGWSSRLNHARSPLFPDLGEAAEPLKGLPPPNIHSLPPITAEPGTLLALGRLARGVQVSAAMS